MVLVCCTKLHLAAVSDLATSAAIFPSENCKLLRWDSVATIRNKTKEYGVFLFFFPSWPSRLVILYLILGLFVLRFALCLCSPMCFYCSHGCLLWEDLVKYICFQNMNYVLSQFSGKKTSLGLLLVWDVLYLPPNGAITFAGESHGACHNDTQDLAP